MAAATVVSDIKGCIMTAFQRQADLDAANVTITTDGSTVKLSARVKAWNERSIAGPAAWAAPGVSKVEDHIVVAF
jgi:osmotically-inducible protein OsmY